MLLEMNLKTYKELSPESQEKVDCLYRIAIMIKKAKHPPLSTKEFDKLYDMPLREVHSKLHSARQFYQELMEIDRE